MDTIIKNKSAVLALTGLILAFFFYSIFLGGGSDVMEETLPNPENTNLVELSRELSTINFNDTIFTTPGYVFLVDFSAELAPQPIGRPNPFGVIGRD